MIMRRVLILTSGDLQEPQYVGAFPCLQFQVNISLASWIEKDAPCIIVYGKVVNVPETDNLLRYG